MKNVFYFYRIGEIGGIETFFYQLAKKYEDYDITIYYSYADKKQIDRLKKYVRVKSYNGETIKCKKAFFNYNLDIIDNVEAEEYIQIIHGCYGQLGIKPSINKKITKYLAVSETAKVDFENTTGLKANVIYNPILLDKPKKVLNLISATRLSAEKGKNRMIEFAKLLDNNNVPYLWTIFTDNTNIINNPNIIYMKPRLDITNYIANADYLVQLSDSEAYCYSIVESLCVGTPVIVTDMPITKELGLNETNSFILDFNMENVPINDIYNKKLKFNYIPKVDNWKEYLEKGKSIYKEELKMKYEVEALDTYERLNILDNELKEIPKMGKRWMVNKERLDVLLGNNDFKEAFVNVIKEVNEDKPKKSVTKKTIKK